MGRLPLDARRSVYLVKVGTLEYVVGASEGGRTRLGEIDAAEVPPASPPGPSQSFGDVLSRVLQPGRGSKRE
jgi:flagellar biogenesis protein FliO